MMFSNRRQQVSSGAKWEAMIGYSRAVKVGPFISVSGTTSLDKEGQVFAKGDPYQQTLRILQIIEAALAELGATMENVTRTRIFVTNIQDWEAIGRAHGEYFKDIRPAATMLEVKALIDPDLLLEIEVDAILLND